MKLCVCVYVKDKYVYIYIFVLVFLLSIVNIIVNFIINIIIFFIVFLDHSGREKIPSNTQKLVAKDSSVRGENHTIATVIRPILICYSWT